MKQNDVGQQQQASNEQKMFYNNMAVSSPLGRQGLLDISSLWQKSLCPLHRGKEETTSLGSCST